MLFSVFYLHCLFLHLLGRSDGFIVMCLLYLEAWTFMGVTAYNYEVSLDYG